MDIKTKMALWLLASLAFIGLPTLTAQPNGMSTDLSRETLLSVEKAYNLPIGLLSAICQVESGCNRYQAPVREPLTKDYAYGPFQMRRIAYRDVLKNSASILPAQTNTGLAILTAQYLNILRKRCGSWTQAISYYNTGRCLQVTRYNQKVLGLLPRPTRLALNKESLSFYAQN